MRAEHTFPPCFDADSTRLILGSFPSVKSRETSFYYGHPQNRFWRLLAAIFEEDVPNTVEEKKALLYRNHIALWDVVASCEIVGSSDSSIRQVVPHDLQEILSRCAIERIYVNGKTAQKLYQKWMYPTSGREAVLLPSSSPANAAWGWEKLLAAWRAALLDKT